MYRVSKQFTFSASHQLELPYESKCNRLHGHNYTVILTMQAEELDSNGMVIDYNRLKPFGDFIDRVLDHNHLNRTVDPATAENVAYHLFTVAVGILEKSLLQVYSVEVREGEKTSAVYIRPDGYDPLAAQSAREVIDTKEIIRKFDQAKLAGAA